MRVLTYDIEVYPNLFCITFQSVKTGKFFAFKVTENENELESLYAFLELPALLAGYNSIFYDDKVLKWVLFNRSLTNRSFLKHCFKLSSEIISGKRPNIPELGIFKNIRFLDLFQIKASGMNKVSLKQLAINLRWFKIQDLPYRFDQPLTLEQIDEVINYNYNDVAITTQLYKKVEKKVDMRLKSSTTFEVDILNQTESGIADIILEKFYKKIDPQYDFKSKTKRKFVNFRECIAESVTFKTTLLQNFLNKIKNVQWTPGSKCDFEIAYGGVKFSIGVGGIHTQDKPGIFESTSAYNYRDADGTSFYPNLVINNNAYPAHLKKEFIGVVQEIINIRQPAKKAGGKAFKELKNLDKSDVKYQELLDYAEEQMSISNILKITANSIIGKFNFEYSWLYDPQAFCTVTLTGQLQLLMLAERLYDNGFELISANTDGVVAKIPVSRDAEYYAICEQWEKDTLINLEYTDYQKYIRRDVNNYLTIKPDGELKQKGIFVTDVELYKGFQHPIVKKALLEYYVNDTPVKDTIESEQSIYEFCISQKSGSQFKLQMWTTASKEDLQKTNRFYVSNGGGTFVKVNKESNQVNRIVADSCVTILNDVDENIPISEYDINYDWYIRQVQEIIDIIQPKQLSLF